MFNIALLTFDIPISSISSFSFWQVSINWVIKRLKFEWNFSERLETLLRSKINLLTTFKNKFSFVLIWYNIAPRLNPVTSSKSANVTLSYGLWANNLKASISSLFFVGFPSRIFFNYQYVLFANILIINRKQLRKYILFNINNLDNNIYRKKLYICTVYTV